MFLKKTCRPLCTFLVVTFLLFAYSSLGYAAEIVKEYTIIPANIDGQGDKLEAMIYRPDADGVYPLIVLNHGRSSDAEKRKDPNLVYFYKTQAETLAQKGFVVVLAVRRGYGKSEGADAEYSTSSTIYQAGLAGTKDVAEVVKFMQGKPYVDSTHTILLGQSCGGLVSVACTTKDIPGLVGVVNFDGGLRHTDRTNPDSWSSDDVSYLLDTYTSYGKKAKVPTIWIYSATDQYFPADLSPKMFAAFIKGGGTGEFFLLPDSRQKGHDFFPLNSTISTWMPILEQFLDKLQIPHN